MPATWVLVADSSAARIFNAGSPTGSLDEIASYAHAEGRMHERDMRTDEPGMTKDSAGYAKHGMEPKVKPKEQEAITFARFLADRLESARSKNEIGRIILVAPPEFLVTFATFWTTMRARSSTVNTTSMWSACGPKRSASICRRSCTHCSPRSRETFVRSR